MIIGTVLIIFIIIFIFWYFSKNKKQQLPYEVVVAKYNEDISWTSKYEHVRIYDKFENKDLPNIGREPHTYLTYIVENYDNLPRIVFFTQGRISDHYNEDYDFLNIQNFSKNYGYQTSNYYFYCKQLGWNKDHLYDWKGPLYPKEELGFTQWFKKYIDDTHDIDESVTWWVGAIFSVSKEKIQSRPKEYYQMLLDLIPATNAPEIAHYFERSWFYIFNCNKYDQ